MSKIEYRAATVNDLCVLRKFEQTLITIERAFDAQLKSNEAVYYDLEELISDDASYLVVAEDTGEVVGSGYGQIRESKSCFETGEHCYIGFIYVNDSCRGMGVAKKVIDTICNWSEERGVGYFLLDVYSENKNAVRVYEKLGFQSLSVKMELKR